MSKLYDTLKTELIDPELEAKVNVDVQPETAFVDIPTDLYAAITTKIQELSAEVEATSPEAKQFVYTIPNRLYTQIIPEKPAVLAEERIFVYVPKVGYDSAGIAKFKTTQFNVINGEVSLKQSYLTEVLSSNLLNPELILVVTVLPSVGIVNRIYLIPIEGSMCSGHIWNSTTHSWNNLGNITLNLDNYYTVAEVIEAISAALTNYYTVAEIQNLLSEVTIDLSSYYTKTEITALLNDINTALTNNYTKTEVNNIIAQIVASSTHFMYTDLASANASGGLINEIKFIKIGEVII